MYIITIAGRPSEGGLATRHRGEALEPFLEPVLQALRASDCIAVDCRVEGECFAYMKPNQPIWEDLTIEEFQRWADQKARLIRLRKK